MLIQTRVPKLRERAVEFGLAANHVYSEIHLGASLRNCVFDAMFSIGIMKVGLRPSGLGDEESWLHDTGKPFAEPVGLDDWVHDMTARRWDQCRYLGNRYRLPLDFVKESKLFESAATDNLGDAVQRLYNETGDPRASSISQREAHYSEGEYERMVELWDIWLPFENKIITVPSQMYGSMYREPLRVIDWHGPETGPYDILSLADVPDNTMPLPPVATWLDLHETLNTLYNKMRRQAERQKEIFAYQGGADHDAQNIVDARDGQSVRVDNPDKMNNLKFGGVDSTNLAFALNAKDQASMVMGNLDMLAGLGAQSDTLGQDRLIA